jgi:hypothetical protein
LPSRPNFSRKFTIAAFSVSRLPARPNFSREFTTGEAVSFEKRLPDCRGSLSMKHVLALAAKVPAAKGGETVFIDHSPLTIHHQKVTGFALNSGYHLFTVHCHRLLSAEIDFLKFN